MIYVLKTILFICSIVVLYKAIINENFNYLYDGTILGLLAILINLI